jgi:hypothetical protein
MKKTSTMYTEEQMERMRQVRKAWGLSLGEMQRRAIEEWLVRAERRIEAESLLERMDSPEERRRGTRASAHPARDTQT